MRASLLFLAIGTVAVGTSAIAQEANLPRISHHSGMQSALGKTETATALDIRPNDQLPSLGWLPTPAIRKDGASLLRLGPGDSLMGTYYDFQTNGSMGERAINWGGVEGDYGILGTMIWMAAPADLDPNASPGRGTFGFVYYNTGSKDEWQSIDFSDVPKRIEPAKSGFNAIGHLADGRVVAVSHRGTDGINYMREPAAATGSFDVTLISESAGKLWPRMAVGGNDVVHVIATPSEGADINKLYYYRSGDGGDTWTAMQIAGTGSALGALPAASGGDAYAIAANGDNVVIWYATRSVSIVQLRSYDGGITWPVTNDATNEAIFVDQPRQIRDSRPGTGAPDTAVMWTEPETDTSYVYRTDTAVAPGTSMDVMIDADGTVHGVYSIFPTYVVRQYSKLDPNDTLGSGIIYKAEYNYTDAGLLYATIDPSKRRALSIVPLPQGLTNPGTFLEYRAYQGGFARWPQMGRTENGAIYLAFSSGAAGDAINLLDTSGGNTEERPYYFSHTYVTSTADGIGWAPLYDLGDEETGVDRQFPSLANNVDDELFLVYQADRYPGDFLSSFVAGGSGLHPATPSAVEVAILKANTLPAPGTAGVENRETRSIASGAIVSAVPNPTSGRSQMTYQVVSNGQVSIRLVDAMGRTISELFDGHRVAGTYTLGFDVSALPSGSYFLVMNAGSSVSSKPLNVVR